MPGPGFEQVGAQQAGEFFSSVTWVVILCVPAEGTDLFVEKRAPRCEKCDRRLGSTQWPYMTFTWRLFSKDQYLYPVNWRFVCFI